MRLDKAARRDKMRHKKKNGMRVSGKSVFVIRQTIINRASNAGKSRNS